ncbi:penicillin-binding protein activator [Neisseriaceae bacterium JH1-16]|nr:penicillin-binding protein activator [Neisseriaceae bacterium JH1-16]
MQKLAPLLVGVMMAWLTAAVAQTPDYIIQQNQLPLQTFGRAVPPLLAEVLPKTIDPGFAPGTQPLAPVVTPPRAGLPKIVLMLPTESKSLGEAAQVVKSGFDAAAAVDQAANVVFLPSEENTAVAQYRAALAQGANVIVGPLTRPAIAAVAPLVSVPTLALNSLDAGIKANPKLYSLSLTVEGEARQLAEQLRDDGRNSPLVIGNADPLSQRLEQAFNAEWRKLGGAPAALFDVSRAAPEQLTALAAQHDALVFTMGAAETAQARALTGMDEAAYAGSQINVRSPDPVLRGMRVIDMPWFLMPQHPAVQRYARPAQPLTRQTERLYALGIDAYRLAVQLAGKGPTAGMRLDGVTGDLRLGRDRQFVRHQPLAVIGSESLQ